MTDRPDQSEADTIREHMRRHLRAISQTLCDPEFPFAALEEAQELAGRGLEHPAEVERDDTPTYEELEAEVERLERSLEGVRRLIYGSRSAFEAGEDRERPHHFDSAVCPKIVNSTDGNHPSACSFRVEQIEAVAEIIETALSDQYAATSDNDEMSLREKCEAFGVAVPENMVDEQGQTDELKAVLYRLLEAADADESTLRWLARRLSQESVENNRIRHAAQKMLDVCFAGHRVVERGADKPLMEAAENLKYALDAAEDGGKTDDVQGLVRYKNGETHLADADLYSVCSAPRMPKEWDRAEAFDPSRHDHEEAISRLTCPECRQMLAEDGQS